MVTKQDRAKAEKLMAEAAKLLEMPEGDETITPEDETKGVVGDSEEEEESDENVVIEKADSGRGFQIYRDYSKDSSGKLKRLVR